MQYLGIPATLNFIFNSVNNLATWFYPSELHLPNYLILKPMSSLIRNIPTVPAIEDVRCIFEYNSAHRRSSGSLSMSSDTCVYQDAA